MKSDKEKIFENHIADYLTDEKRHNYQKLTSADCTDTDYHLIKSHLPSLSLH